MMAWVDVMLEDNSVVFIAISETAGDKQPMSSEIYILVYHLPCRGNAQRAIPLPCGLILHVDVQQLCRSSKAQQGPRLWIT